MATFDLGTHIGHRQDSDTASPVCIPLHVRDRHTWIVGRCGTGKSELLKRIIYGDIIRGEGCVVLDPHGTLVNDLLTLVPPEHAQRTLVLEFSDARWVPALNPLAGVVPANRQRAASQIAAILLDADITFGDRAQYILFSVLCGLLHVPGTNLADAIDVLRKDAKTSKLLRKQVLQAADSTLLKKFWKDDLQRHSKHDLQRAQWVIFRHLLSDPSVSRTFGQRQNKIDFRQVLDERLVILVNLSDLSPRAKSMLASVFISSLQLEARVSDTQCPSQRLPFNLYNDGIPVIGGGGWEDALAEGRRHGIRICACVQFLDQLPQSQADWLEMAGTTISFRVGRNDAQKLRDRLLPQVDVAELVSLEQFEAVARIGNEVVRFKTRPLPAPDSGGCRAAIIDASHQRYYRTADEVQREFNE